MNSSCLTERLKTHLQSVVDGLAALMKDVPVHRKEPSQNVSFITPEYYWGDLADEQKAEQLRLKRDLKPVAELLYVLLSGAPDSLIDQYKTAVSKLSVWIEFESNWELKPNPSENEASLRSDAKLVNDILTVFAAIGETDLVLVPDTNSLLTAPDPEEYRVIAGDGRFVFLLLPTVLGELNQLKTAHRNPQVREKARAVNTRIKGWRKQGRLVAGVTVNKTITIRAHAAEPNMMKTLPWLDPAVQDDRILASVVALQAELPAARVILVTNDINLMNKADAALVESTEVPVVTDGRQHDSDVAGE